MTSENSITTSYKVNDKVLSNNGPRFRLSSHYYCYYYYILNHILTRSGIILGVDPDIEKKEFLYTVKSDVSCYRRKKIKNMVV